MVKGQRNEKLVLDLGIGSQLLRSLHNKFCTFLRSTDSRIICIYETKLSPTVEVQIPPSLVRSRRLILLFFFSN